MLFKKAKSVNEEETIRHRTWVARDRFFPSIHVVFYLLIAIIIIVFIIDSLLDILNALHYDDEIPDELSDVYPEEEYKKSIAYKKANYKFKMVLELLDLVRGPR